MFISIGMLILIVGVVWYAASKETEKKLLDQRQWNEQQRLAKSAEDADRAAEVAGYAAEDAKKAALEKIRRAAIWPGPEPVQERICVNCEYGLDVDDALQDAFRDASDECPFCGEKVEVGSVDMLAKEKAKWLFNKQSWEAYREALPEEALKAETQDRDFEAEWAAYLHQEYKAAVAARRAGRTALDWFFCPECEEPRERTNPHSSGEGRTSGGAECRNCVKK
jgi:hypothetical protein